MRGGSGTRLKRLCLCLWLSESCWKGESSELGLVVSVGRKDESARLVEAMTQQLSAVSTQRAELCKLSTRWPPSLEKGNM